MTVPLTTHLWTGVSASDEKAALNSSSEIARGSVIRIGFVLAIWRVDAVDE